MKLSVIFVGTLRDGGFNQAALEGAERVRSAGTAEVAIVDGVPYEQPAMIAALEAAADTADGVVFVGGQGNIVTPAVAARFPDTAFAVVQGNVTGPNLYSYDVLQEQSAFLAGALAARLTRTGAVGHLSGHRVAPGLKGRAAFAAGVAHADPSVRLITGFCGTQDHSPTTDAWARGIAARGVDILFTMLNAAREGATTACRATGMRQIGNAKDWCAVDPKVFVASAVARIDLGVETALQDMIGGVRAAGMVALGLAERAVGLTFAPDVSGDLRAEISALSDAVAMGKVTVSTDYTGPDYEGPA